MPLRVTVGDTTPDSYEFQDGHLDAALRLVVRGGMVPGHALNPGMDGISPGLDDPNHYLLTVYEAAVILVRPRTEGTSYRTRALSERFDGQKILFYHLLQETGRLQEMREGTLFRSWQDLGQFVAGNYGSSLWERLVEVKVSGPIATLHIP